MEDRKLPDKIKNYFIADSLNYKNRPEGHNLTDHQCAIIYFDGQLEIKNTGWLIKTCSKTNQVLSKFFLINLS